MKKVIGIGGIFFKSKNPSELQAWYAKHLGFVITDYGVNFISESKDEQTIWCPFKEDTKYFEPSQKEFMINYRVENLEELVKILKQEGVNVLDEIAVYDFGKFVHLLDPEENKIELWEPK